MRDAPPPPSSDCASRTHRARLRTQPFSSPSAHFLPPRRYHPAPTSACARGTFRHALTHDPARGFLYTWLHLPLNICIVVMGCVLEPLVAESAFPVEAQWMLALACALLMLITGVFELLHVGLPLARFSPRVRFACRAALALLVALLPAYRPWHSDEALVFVALMTALLIAAVALAIWSRHAPPHAHARAHAQLTPPPLDDSEEHENKAARSGGGLPIGGEGAQQTLLSRQQQLQQQRLSSLLALVAPGPALPPPPASAPPELPSLPTALPLSTRELEGNATTNELRA